MTLPGGKAMGLCLLPPPPVQLCCLRSPSPRSSPPWAKCLQPTIRRLLTWHLTAITPTLRRRLEIVIALSPSSLLVYPLLPLPGPANRTLLVAIASRSPWTSSLTSPQAPATSPLTSPKLTSLASTLPSWPGAVPWRLSNTSLLSAVYGYNASDYT